MRRMLILTVLAALLAPVHAPAHPLTQGPCEDVTATVSMFARGGTHLDSWYENLDFDGLGGLWTTNLTAKRLERYDASGARTASFPLPHYSTGVRRGPDGMIYVGFIVFTDDVSRADRGGVLRVDPHAAAPQIDVVSDATAAVNGVAFDAQGNLYLGHTWSSGVGRLTPAGEYDSDWAPVAGTNGLNQLGDALYATETVEPRSRVWRIPLGDPMSAKPLVELSAPPLAWKWVDDGTIGPDGRLYLGTHATGELLRVDLDTGATCVVLDGLHNPTSARFAGAFGDTDPEHDLFVTEGSGDILRVRLSAGKESS